MMTTETSNDPRRATGPRTPEGKAAVSRNRTLHNLTGAQVLLPGESREAYDELLAALIDEHDPAGVTERFLVEQLAQNQWRLIRIAEMESEIFAAMAGLLPPGDPAAGADESLSPAARAARRLAAASSPEEAHARLTRYEASIRRAYHAALTQLRTTQNARLRNAESRRTLAARAEDHAYDRLIQDFDSALASQLLGNTNYDSNSPEPDPRGGGRSVMSVPSTAASSHGPENRP